MMTSLGFADARDEARRYLGLLWGEGTPRGDLSFFTIPADIALHLSSQDLDVAAHEAVQASLGGENVYASACLMDPALRPRADIRGKASDATVITGVWSDLDVAGPAHASTSLPSTPEEWLKKLPEKFPPTMVVATGHGLQVYWLFSGPKSLEDDGARERARQLVEGAQNAIRARSNGWVVDPTADLARLLRVPGTTNWKIPDEPVPVRILFDDGPRYEAKALVDAWSDLGRDRHKEPPPPFGERIATGERTHAVTRVAGWCRRVNLPERMALAWAAQLNETLCDPPLSDRKVAETVAGIYGRYDPDESILAGANGTAPSRKASGVDTHATAWIWEPFLPLAKLCIHAGEPGTFKSAFDVAVAAAITTGTGFAEPYGPRNVVFLNFEDDAEDGLVPRLMAAGADLERVYICDEDAGLAGLTATVNACHPLAVFIDPFGSWAEETDGSVESQVRKSLKPLKRLAKASGAMVKVNCHPNKQNSLSDALYRISGSLGGMVGYARVVLASKRTESGYVAGIVKSNCGPDELGVDYAAHIVAVKVSNGTASVPRVYFGATHKVTRKTFFASEEEKAPTKVMQCAEAITQHMNGQPKFASDIRPYLMGQGFGKETINDGCLLAGCTVTGRGRNCRWWPPGVTVPSRKPHDPRESSDTTESEGRLRIVPSDDSLGSPHLREEDDDEEEGDA